MKRLFVAIAAATLAYSAWWFYAAHNLRTGVEAWFEDQRAAGWDASYSDITVRGFPSRTDLTLTNPMFRSPDDAFGWQAPFFQILGLSYKPGHVIVAWANTQTLTIPDGTFEIASDGLRASLVYDNDLILRTNLEAEVFNLTGAEQSLALAGVNAALKKVDLSTAGYRLALTVDSLATTDPAVTGSLVPEALASLRADSSIDLTDPLTLQNVLTSPPNPTKLTVRLAEVGYGALTLKLTGETEFDNAGRATGEVTFEADNWRESLETAKKNGDLPPGLSEGLVDLMSMIASLSGGRETLDVTLGLNRGTVLLGPLPVGQLPPLRWP